MLLYSRSVESQEKNPSTEENANELVLGSHSLHAAQLQTR